MAVDLDDGGVDHGVFRLVRDGIKEPHQDIGFRPAAITFEHVFQLAEARRQIAPGTAGPHDPKERFDEVAVVAPTTPGVRRFA